MAVSPLRPFAPYFGSKWLGSLHYPAPVFDRIVEPFAGLAGYSTRYAAHDVVLCDCDPAIAGLWRWLIHTATPREVLALPDVEPGQLVAELGVHDAAATLIGLWLGRGLARPRLRGSTSSWATNPDYAAQFWGPIARQRVAEQLSRIRHWTIIEGDYTAVSDVGPSSWIIDAPYRKRAGERYRHGAEGIDFEHLGQWSRSRPGQVIVCEADGADWLPFQSIEQAFTRMSTRSRGTEAIWLNHNGRLPRPADQLALLL